jgi:hypothetical protein
MSNEVHYHRCNGCGHVWGHARPRGWNPQKGQAEMASDRGEYLKDHTCPKCPGSEPVFPWYRGPLHPDMGFFPMNQA